MTPAVRLLFRAEAGQAMGFGHLSRARSLATAFARHRPCKTIFAVENTALARSFLGPLATVVSPESLEGLSPFDAVIVDLPNLSPAEQDRLGRLGHLVVGIDDEGPGPFSFDVLIRPTPLPCPLPDNGDRPVWHGGDYVILHPAFADQAAWSGEPRFLGKRLLVCFGGSDPTGLTLRLLPLLAHSPALLSIQIVAGVGFPSREALVGLADADSRVELAFDLKDMAGAFRAADAALVSGGTLLYEACALGVPAVVVSQNREQAVEAAFFANQGAALDLGTTPGERRLLSALDRLLGDPILRAKIASAGRRLVAADGSARIVKQLLKRMGKI